MRKAELFFIVGLFVICNLFLSLLVFEEFAHSHESDDPQQAKDSTNAAARRREDAARRSVLLKPSFSSPSTVSRQCLPEVGNVDDVDVELTNDATPIDLAIPKPRSVIQVSFTNFFALSLDTTMTVKVLEHGRPRAAPHEVVKQHEEDLADTLQHVLWCDVGIAPMMADKKEGKTQQPNRITLLVDFSLELAAYKLRITEDEIEITAGSREGVLYAWSTLKQLMPEHSFSPSLTQQALLHFTFINITAGIEVEDAPDYAWRGLMVDAARHFVSMSHMRKILRHMLHLKLNVLHWHLTDDQGWRIESKRFPRLHLSGGRRGASKNNAKTSPRYAHSMAYPHPVYYSQEEIVEFVALARAHGIDVVPEIDTPAHSAALITAAREHGVDLGVVELHEGCRYDQAEERAMFKDGNGAAVNCMGGTHGMIVPDAAATRFLRQVLDEALSLFQSPIVHLGGDEAAQFRDEVYKARVPGQLPPAAVQRQLFDAMVEYLGPDRTVIAWDETFLSSHPPKKWPKDRVRAMWWRDWAPEAKANQVGKNLRSVPIIAAPVSRAYFDLYQMEPHSASEHLVQEGTVSLRDAFRLCDVYNDVRGSGATVVGLEGVMWSETLTSWKVWEYQAFPRVFALAHCAWASGREQVQKQQFKQYFLRSVSMNLKRMIGVNAYRGNYTG
eukprot:PhM_4_TR14212/c0_g1_i1/m.101605/K12373/HEXA_B; hexosaminidase